MMSRWYCLNCDNCGDPGPMAETPNQARQERSAGNASYVSPSLPL